MELQSDNLHAASVSIMAQHRQPACKVVYATELPDATLLPDTVQNSLQSTSAYVVRGKRAYQGLKLLLLIEAVGEQPLAIRDMEALLSTLIQASFGAESGHAYKMEASLLLGTACTKAHWAH